MFIGDSMTEIEKKIKELRKTKKLTQVEFARIFQISNGTIAMWETDKRQPDFNMLQKLADYFGVTRFTH